MSRINYYLSFFHGYTTNMFLLYFIILFLNIHNGKQPLLLSYMMVVLGVLTAGWIIVHYFRLRYIYIILPFVLVTATMLGFHWLSALALSFVPILRFEYLYDDIEDTLAAPSIIITFLLLLGVNILGSGADSSFQTEYHLLFISQVLFYFIGRIVLLLLGSPYVHRGKFTVFLSLSGIFITLGVILAIAYRYAVFSLKYIVIVLLGGMVQILKPFFAFLEDVEFEPPQLSDSERLDQTEGEESAEMVQAESTASHIPVDTIMSLLLLLIIGIGIYYFYKRREAPAGQKTEKNEKEGMAIAHSSVKKNYGKPEVPKNKVRKLYYGFEKWLASKGLGRYRNETIEEWIRRCRLEEIVDSDKLEIYRRTRYMDQETSDADYQKYKYAIDHMKQVIMQHMKKQE
ncbi:hypothetical protein CFN03_11735 [Salinicoccus roseus]|uniref:DUF4129 domain-containing protein n=2 Tax=Salinicoccus roseus TaxID=45670 RepID=A0A265E502_9STAP|nr:hypothetical protein CFN03_11735 [Salinicoccus roseus]